jgi:hypothetical protein
MLFGIGVLYKNLSRKREFSENRHSDRRALLQGVYEFIPIFSISLLLLKKGLTATLSYTELPTFYKMKA